MLDDGLHYYFKPQIDNYREVKQLLKHDGDINSSRGPRPGNSLEVTNNLFRKSGNLEKNRDHSDDGISFRILRNVPECVCV